MDRHHGESEEDREFEAYLRQFRAPTPRGLPARRATVGRAAVAAGLVLAALIPLRSLWTGRAADNGSSATPQDAAPPAATSTRPSNSPAGPSRQTPLQNGPLRVDGVRIPPPKRIFNVDPEYPENAKAAGVEGVVVLQIIIAKSGSVTVERVLRSVPMLDEAAIEAVSQWEYEPTLLNGQPVEMEMNVTLNFTLQ